MNTEHCDEGHSSANRESLLARFKPWITESRFGEARLERDDHLKVDRIGKLDTEATRGMRVAHLRICHARFHLLPGKVKQDTEGTTEQVGGLCVAEWRPVVLVTVSAQAWKTVVGQTDVKALNIGVPEYGRRPLHSGVVDEALMRVEVEAVVELGRG